jgi:type II secretory pathway component PulF
MAASENELRQWIRAQGWVVLSISTAGLDAGPKSLRVAEAEQVLMQLAELAESNVPIVEGMRAAASAAGSRRFARIYRRVAAGVERGEQLPSVVARIGMPRYLRGVLAAAQRSGRTPQFLFEILEQQQTDRDMRLRALAVLFYPVSLLLAMCAIAALVLLFVVPEFREMFEGFGMTLPRTTLLIFWWAEYGIWTMISLAMIIALGLLTAPLCLGRGFWNRLLRTLPWIGHLWRSSEAARFARLLGALLSCKVPLPEAVLLSGEAVSDLNIDNACDRMAEQLDQGGTLSAALALLPLIPPPLVAFVRWGEIQNTLPESLAAAGELLEGRARLQSLAVVQCLPPLLFVLILGLAVAVVVAILLPLLTVTTSLT